MVRTGRLNSLVVGGMMDQVWSRLISPDFDIQSPFTKVSVNPATDSKSNNLPIK
mgnify:CR=1 FL=1